MKNKDNLILGLLLVATIILSSAVAGMIYGGIKRRNFPPTTIDWEEAINTEKRMRERNRLLQILDSLYLSIYGKFKPVFMMNLIQWQKEIKKLADDDLRNLGYIVLGEISKRGL